MLKLREREGSGVLGAREDRGKLGGGKSAEVSFPRRRRSPELSQCSAESRSRSEALTGAFGRRPVLAESRCMRGWPPRSSAREKERRDTGGLPANNDHTGGVEGLSGPRRGGVPQTRRQNSFQRKTVVNRRFTRSAQSRFTKRAGRVLTSAASRRRPERRMQHSADER